MGDQPQILCNPESSPFTAVCLDLLSPIRVCTMCDKHTEMKYWPIRLVCQATGSVHTQVMENYGTEVFLTQWDHFTNIRGDPAVAVCDCRSQLTSAINSIAFPTKEVPSNCDLDQDNSIGTKKGNKCELILLGAQFHNGLAGHQMASIKESLLR